MDLSKINKKALVAAVSALVLIPSAIWAAQRYVVPPVVNCEAGGSCNVTVNVPASPVDIHEESLGATANQDFTDLTGLRLSGDLLVNGTSTFTGTSTFGNVVGVAANSITSMSSSATTTACAVLNTSGNVRTVFETSVRDVGTAASLGAVSWSAGTTTAPGIAIAPTELLIAGAVTRVSGVDKVTPTSTAKTTSFVWKSGEYLVFVSNTTTNAGACRALYY